MPVLPTTILHRRLLAALLPAVLALSPALRAQVTLTWADNDTDFATATNWLESTAPANSLTTHIARFGTFFITRQPFLSASQSVNGVVFTNTSNSGISLIGPGTLTLGDSGVNNTTATGTQTVSVPLALGAQANFTNAGALTISGPVNNGGFQLRLTGSGAGGTLSGVLSGAGVLIKSNTGTWNLTGANTYTGGTFIDAGTLALGSAGALGSSGTIDFRGGTLQFSASNTTDYSARFKTDETSPAFNFDTNGQSVTLASALSSASGGTLTKSGLGTLTLSGANTYTLGSTITAGLVRFSALNNFGTGNITLNGGGIQWAAGATTDLASRLNPLGAGGGTLDTNGNNVALSTAFSGAGALTKTGLGTLTLTGASAHTGGTTISAGTLALGASARLPDTGALTVSGGTFNLGAFNDTVGAVTLASGTLTGTTGVLTGTSFAVHSGTISAILAGAGGLTKSTAGTVTLGASNLLPTGSVFTVSGGTFALGSTNQTVGALTLTAGSITGTGTLNSSSFDVESGTVSASLGGAGLLTKSTTGTVTLSGANTHTGGTALSAGTLALGSTGALGSSGTISFSGGTLQFSASNTIDYSSRFSTAASQIYQLDTNGQSVTLASALASSGGSLHKSGAGTLTLTGSNTYSGGTNINAGTLQIGAGGAIGAITSSTIANNAALVYNHSVDKTYAGVISGGGTFTKLGAGTLTLSGANSYTGATTISAGTLQLGAGGTTGSISSGSNIVDNAALAFNRSDAVTYSGVISGGGSLTKLGGGTLTLSGINTYTGGTTVSAGTLTFGNTDRLAPTGALTVSGGTFALGATNQTVGALTLTSGSITANPGFVLTGSSYSVQSGTISAKLAGNGGLTKSTAGTVTLSGANTYQGGTTVSAGTLALGASESLASAGALTISGGTFSLGAFNQFISGAVTLASGSITGTTGLLSPSNTFAVQSGTISANFTVGSGGLTKSNGGTVTLTGNGTVSGGTTINAGTLQVGDGGTTGSLASGSVSLNGGNLTFNRSDDVTFAGNLSGALSGSAVVNAGAGNVTLSGGLSMANVAVNGAGTLTLASGVTPASGADLVKSGSGTLIATAGTISPPKLWIDAGTVRLDPGGSLNNTANANIAAGASLVFNQSADDSFFGAITGAGSLLKSGSGTLSLGVNQFGSSSNSLSGVLTITGGLVQFFSAGNLGNGGVTLNGGGLKWASSTTTDVSSRLTPAIGAGGATFDTNGNNVALSTAFSGSGALTKSGTGTLTLTGANSHTGGTTINAGTLALGASGALGSTGPIAFGGGTLQFSSANTGDLSARLSTAANQTYRFDTNGQSVTLASALTSAGGTFIKYGTGTLTLSGANTYTGGTFIQAGTLQLGADGALPNATALTVNAGALDLAGHAFTTSALSGAGGISLGSATLTAGQATDTTFAGAISGAGALAKSGAGTLTLTGANTYAGGTTISSGTLQLGASGALPSGTPVSLSSGATLDLNGHGATLGSLAGAGTVTNGGATLTVAQSGNSTFSGGLSGSGGLAKSGSGLLTLTGTNTFSGATAITGGQIKLNGSAANSAFTLSGGGVLSGNGTVGALTIGSGGRLSPGNSPGTTNAGNTTFASGGAFQFEVNDATGTAGADPGWDLLAITGALDLTATSGSPFTLNLTSLTLANTAGLTANFDSAANFAFTFVTTTGGITGFSADKFAIDTTNFTNPFSAGAWSVSLTSGGNNLSLNYAGASAIPEPSTYALFTGLAALAVAAWRRRRRRA